MVRINKCKVCERQIPNSQIRCSDCEQKEREAKRKEQNKNDNKA